MYEYKVVPAPQRAVKVKGLKSAADRFAHALSERINAEAAGGWEFLRTESLTCEERSGLGRTRTSTQTMMVFARALGQARPSAGAALEAVQAEAIHHEVATRAEPTHGDVGHEARHAPEQTPQTWAKPAPEPEYQPVDHSHAAAQHDARHYDAAPREDTRYAGEPHAAGQHDSDHNDAHRHDGGHYEATPDRYALDDAPAPYPDPHDGPHDAPRSEPAPAAGEARLAPLRRQEPLFRSANMLHGERPARTEPVVRPPRPDGHGDDT